MADPAITVTRAVAADLADLADAVDAYRAARQEAFTGLIPDEAVLPRTPDQDLERWRGFAADPDGRLFVAYLDGKVAGLAALEYESAPAELGALYVNPASQRSGAGGALLRAALDTARDDGHREVIGWVVAANQRAKQFFLTRGAWLDGGVEIRTIGQARLTMQRIRFVTDGGSR